VLLDYRSPSVVWSTLSGEVSIVWLGGWKHGSSSSLMCFLNAILVLCVPAGGSPPFCTTTNRLSLMIGGREQPRWPLIRIKKGLNSLIISRAWIIWNHHNRCVFDGVRPNMVEVLTLVSEERRHWMMAGAWGLSHLMAPIPGDQSLYRLYYHSQPHPL
jgi:hypothetical protein